QALAKQQDVQIQCARAPTFGFALAALGLFDGLQCVEQLQRREAGIQRCDGIVIARLVSRAERIAGIQRRNGNEAAVGEGIERHERAAQLLLRLGKIAAKTYINAFHHSLAGAPSLAPRLRRPPLRRRLRGAPLSSLRLLSSRIMLRRSLSPTS